MEERANTGLWRLEKQAEHGIVLAIVTKQLHLVFGDIVSADWLAVASQVKAEKESDRCGRCGNKDNFSEQRESASYVFVSKLGDPNVDGDEGSAQ